MTYSEFRALVKRMRIAQESYFRGDPWDKPKWLEESKKLERQVDRAIEEAGQQKLF